MLIAVAFAYRKLVGENPNPNFATEYLKTLTDVFNYYFLIDL